MKDKLIGWIGIKLPANALCFSDHMAVFDSLVDADAAILKSGMKGYLPTKLLYTDAVRALLIGDGISFTSGAYKQFYRATNNDVSSPMRGKLAHFSSVGKDETIRIKHSNPNIEMRRERDENIQRYQLGVDKPEPAVTAEQPK